MKSDILNDFNQILIKYSKEENKEILDALALAQKSLEIGINAIPTSPTSY